MNEKRFFFLLTLNMMVLSSFIFMFLITSKTSMIVEVFISSFFMLSLSMLIDTISMIFLVTVFLISTLVLLYSMEYMKGENENKFYLMMLMFISFMIILCLSGNLLWVMVGWDGLGVSSFALIMYFQNWKSFNSAVVTFMCNRVGDLFILTSIVWFMSFGTLITWINQLPLLIPLMIMITALSKSAQIPFSSWLPLAMAAPTPVSSLVHSSTLVTAGVFLMIRLYSMMEHNVLIMLMFVSSSTVLLAGISATWEFDLKKIIALSTLSHVGLMMMFISIGDTWPAMSHLVTHSMFKSVLFMCAGFTIHNMNNTQDIRMINSISNSNNGIMVICIMSMMGLPFMTGFYSKEFMLMSFSSFNLSSYFLISFMMAVMLTCCYSIRLLLYIMMGKFQRYYLDNIPNKGMAHPMLIGCILSITVGGMVMWDIMYSQLFNIEECFNSTLKDLLIMFMFVGVFIGSKSIKFGSLNLALSSMLFISSFCYLGQNFLFKSSFNLINLDIKGWSNYIFNYSLIKNVKLIMNNFLNQPIIINNVMYKTFMLIIMVNMILVVLCDSWDYSPFLVSKPNV